MIRCFPILAVVVMSSCQSTPRDRVQEQANLQLSDQRILKDLAAAHRADPENELVIRQQLYYCEQLNWPVTCAEALKSAKARWGLTSDIIEKYTTFFDKNNQHEGLLALLSSVPQSRTVDELKFKAYQQLGKLKEMEKDLEAYLQIYEDTRAFKLAAHYFLESGNCQASLEQFSNLWTIQPHDTIFADYYPLLVAEAEWTRADTVIKQLLTIDSFPKWVMDHARVQYQLNRRNKAIGVMRNYAGVDSACLNLSQWYAQTSNWDSAIHYQRLVVDRNPKDVLRLIQLANLNEQRGWVTKSFDHYVAALALDTSNLQLRKKVQEVGRKVAYLRSSKEKAETVPLLEIQRKNNLNE